MPQRAGQASFADCPSGSLGHLHGYLRVVDLALELLGSGTDGEGGHVAVGMATALPSDEGTFGHHLTGRFGQTADAGIERLLVLGLPADHLVEGTVQAVELAVGELHLGAEAPILGQVGLHHLPSEAVALLLLQLLEVVAVGLGAHLLEAEEVGVELVGATAQHDAARFVVGRHDDERFVGMLGIEFIGHLHGLVHVDEFTERRGHIVGMAGPVDLAPLDHEEESVLAGLGEVGYAGTGHFGQGHVGLGAVDGIGQGVALALAGLLGLEQDHAVGLAVLLEEVLVASGNGVAGGAALVVERRGRGIGLVGGLEEIASGVEVESGFHQVLTDGVVRTASALVGIESGRSGMVHTHAGAHADGGSGLLGPHGDAVDACGLVGEKAERAVFRLVARGQGRAGGSGVGHAVGAGIGGDKCGIGKLREADGLDADAAFECGQIGLGAVHLVDTHAVANEVEHILGTAFGHNGQHAEAGEQQ